MSKKKKDGILVFISYATKDAQTFQIPIICEKLTEYPEIKDVLYWQEDLQDDIWTYMDKNIGKCDIFVLFCSPNAMESVPVQKEWHAADALNKPIIPVFSSIEYVPPLLRPRLGLQVDVFNVEENIKKLYELIKKKYIPKEDLTISLSFTYKNKTEIIHAEKKAYFLTPLIEFCMKNNLSIKNILVTTSAGTRVPDDLFDESVSFVYSKFGNEFIINIEKMQIVANFDDVFDESVSFVYSKFGNEFIINIEKMQIVANFKVCLIGDAASGKSKLLQHCIEATYDEEYMPTIGVDYWVKPFHFQSIDKNFDIVLIFWDFGGDFEEAGKKKELLNESDGIFVVGDLTRKETFERIETGCVPKIRKVLGEDIPIILLANKCDLEHTINKEHLKELAKRLKLENVFLTSAKTGENVEAAFKSIIAPMIARALKIL